MPCPDTTLVKARLVTGKKGTGTSVSVHAEVDDVATNTILELAADGGRNAMEVSDIQLVTKAAVPPARVLNRVQLAFVGPIWPVK